MCYFKSPGLWYFVMAATNPGFLTAPLLGARYTCLLETPRPVCSHLHALAALGGEKEGQGHLHMGHTGDLIPVKLHLHPGGICKSRGHGKGVVWPQVWELDAHELES